MEVNYASTTTPPAVEQLEADVNRFTLTLEERQFLIHVIACLKTFVPDEHYHWTIKALNILQDRACPNPETIDIVIPTSAKSKEVQLPTLPNKL